MIAWLRILSPSEMWNGHIRYDLLIQEQFDTWVTHNQTPQLHPLVLPQVLHFMQVPLRTRVKFPQVPQASPS
jgi:hypothetical protein